MIAAIGALGSFLAPILFSATGILMSAAVTLALIVLEKLTGLVSAAGTWLLNGVLDVIVAILVFLIDKLPAMPSEPVGSLAPLADMLGFANRYMPISEAFAFLPLIGAFAAGIFGYKLVKLVRGGG